MIILQLKREYRFIQGYLVREILTTRGSAMRSSIGAKRISEKRRKKSVRRGLVFNLFRFVMWGDHKVQTWGDCLLDICGRDTSPYKYQVISKWTWGYHPGSFISWSAHGYNCIELVCYNL